MFEERQPKRRRLSTSTDTPILVISENLLVNVSEYLSLHDCSILASTCRQLREVEQSNEYYVGSIDARIRHLIERVLLWLDETSATNGDIIDVDFFLNDKDNPFCTAMCELNSAGRCGLSGLVELASVVNVEPLYPLGSGSYPDLGIEPKNRKALREKCALILKGTVKSLQWRLCDNHRSKLAKQNICILKEVGTHCLDLKVIRNRITDCNDEIFVACRREHEALYALSILGRAVLPYLKIVLDKLIPPLFHEEIIPGGDEGDEMQDLLHRWEFDTESCKSSDIALLVLRMLRPFLTRLEMRIILDFLGNHLNNSNAKYDEERRRIAAVQILTQLGSLIHGTGFIEKVMSTVKHDLPDYDHTYCHVRAICEFIAELQLTQYLHLPLNWVNTDNLAYSQPAEYALESLEPKLSKCQRKHMINQLLEIYREINDRDRRQGVPWSQEADGVKRVLNNIGVDLNENGIYDRI